ncbi:hypothetical protein [Actinomadura sp. 9N215]|uniref:hypothetical protein n=1 Tax=Actinomadura sp. 9N215 TaxID=3375150 RepID=UPI0037A02849
MIEIVSSDLAPRLVGKPREHASPTAFDPLERDVENAISEANMRTGSEKTQGDRNPGGRLQPQGDQDRLFHSLSLPERPGSHPRDA